MEELEYIASYFEGTLPEAERAGFGERCLNDPLFAREVAGYVMMRDALRQELHQQKSTEFTKLYATMQGRTGFVKKLSWFAVAACIALIAGWLVFFKGNAPKDLARAYAAVHFKQLGVTMGAEGQDLMQKGIAAFNKKEYAAALSVFKRLSTDGTLKPDAVKNLGITQLMMGNYEGAIDSFDALSKMELHTNPGLFYKAIALMERSGPGDAEAAKECLKEVVDKDLPGKKDAEAWLEKL